MRRNSQGRKNYDRIEIIEDHPMSGRPINIESSHDEVEEQYSLPSFAAPEILAPKPPITPKIEKKSKKRASNIEAAIVPAHTAKIIENTPVEDNQADNKLGRWLLLHSGYL